MQPIGWFTVCKVTEVAKKINIAQAFIWGEITITQINPIKIFLKRIGEEEIREIPIKKENGMIIAWFSPDNIPTFDITPIGNLYRQGWSTPFHLSWSFNSNLIEIGENAVDMGHFTSVHVYHDFAKLNKYVAKNHHMQVVFNSSRRILGILNPVEIELHYQGLGWIESKIKSTFAEVYVLYTPTSMTATKIQVQLSVSFKKTKNPILNSLLRLFLPWEVKRDYERDIPIWENKITHQYPMLCHADGPIIQFRTWSQQFFC